MPPEFSKRDIHQRIQNILKERGIEISGQAADLLSSIFESVDTDPHDSWVRARLRPQFRNYAGKFYMNSAYFMEQLPELLQQLTREKYIEHSKRVTFFDVLHWAGNNLESICPYHKE